MFKKLLTSTLTATCSIALLTSSLITPAFADDTYFLHDPQWRFLDDNPAKTTLFGRGRLNLPSFKVSVGTNLPVTSFIQDFQSFTTTLNQLTQGLDEGTALENTASLLETQINNLLSTLDQGLRVDYDINSSVLGFAGSPFTGLKIAGRPLSLGLSVGADTRGFAQLSFSEGFQQEVTTLANSLPTLLTTAQKVSSVAEDTNGLLTQIGRLNTNINDLVTLGTSLASNPLAASTEDLAKARSLLDDVDLDLSATLKVAKDLNSTVLDITSTADNLINTAKSVTAGGISFSTANDLHVTVNLSGAYPVIDNNNFKLSIGTNLKLFVLPYSVPLKDFGIDNNLSAMGQFNIDEISNINTFDSVENTLNQAKNALTEVDNLIEVGESIASQVDKVKNIDADNINNLAGDVTNIVSDLSEGTQSLSTVTETFNDTINSAGQIQQSLQDDLSKARIKGSTVTPSAAGFGMDFGIEAQIRKNLRLGLMLQNPLVIWPGTKSPFEIGFQDVGGNLTPVFDILEDDITSVNYTATVPFAVQLTGQYIFDDLIPRFPGLMVNGLFEVVGNGRAPGFTLGLQKQFGPTYIGFGGRIGGITSMIYGKAGLRQAGPFGMDLMVGIAPGGTGIPFVESLTMAHLSTYLQF